MHAFGSFSIMTLLALTTLGCSSDEGSSNPPSSSQSSTAMSMEEVARYKTLIDQNRVIPEMNTTLMRHNQAAYIPSQCYTKTEDKQRGFVANPCFSCHINSEEPNYIDDWDLQLAYQFSVYTATNHWSNLFKDRTELVSLMSDEMILEYVREDNYFERDGESIRLAKRLQENLDPTWDSNKNGKWDGYVPDCYFNFDNEGFDHTPTGELTGWRAFAYAPFLGTFWPTNGSTDDVLIRLPKLFWVDKEGKVSRDIYKLNLAIVEAMIKRKTITIPETDETLYGIDLDKNGVLNSTTKIVYDWAPTKGRYMHYVGKAAEAFDAKQIKMAAGLYPEGTEFLHTVHYIDVDTKQNRVGMAPRLKELRYGRKLSWNTYPQLYRAALAEIKEKDDFPERLRTFHGDTERGLGTGLGWVYQGFIEDEKGELRPQNVEETAFCIGCHSGLGAIEDSTFAFGRKFDGGHFRDGWYHWSQKGLEKTPEPKLPNGAYEYTTYLKLNRAGDEFRDNQEIMERFFESNGSLKLQAINALHGDITTLLMPSVKRALELNKAYKVIVDEQSFIKGRDAHIAPIKNVHEKVEVGEATGIKSAFKR